MSEFRLNYAIVLILASVFNAFNPIIISAPIYANSPAISGDSPLNITSLFNELGLKPVVWAKLQNNEMAFELRYAPMGDKSGAHSAYAKLNSKGELIFGPIPIDNGGTLMIPETRNTVFANNGVLYGYINSGFEPVGLIVRMSYDPEKREWATVMFDDKEPGSIMSVSHLPSLGNILLNIRYRQGKYLKIIIDDMVSSNPRTIEIDNTDVWASQMGMAVVELSNSRIAILANSNAEKNRYDNFEVNKVIINVNTGIVESNERITTKDFFQGNPIACVLPFQEHGTTFKVNNRTFYLAQGSYGNDLGYRKTIFVEIDEDGNFVQPEDKTQLKFKESAISAMPKNWLLLFDVLSYSRTEDENNVILSLELFPIIVSDKSGHKRLFQDAGTFIAFKTLGQGN